MKEKKVDGQTREVGNRLPAKREGPSVKTAAREEGKKGDGAQ